MIILNEVIHKAFFFIMLCVRREGATFYSMVSAETARQDAGTFQAWVRQRQYPQHCGRTVGLMQRKDYFHVLGLGAQMVALKFGLLNALLQQVS